MKSSFLRVASLVGGEVHDRVPTQTQNFQLVQNLTNCPVEHLHLVAVRPVRAAASELRTGVQSSVRLDPWHVQEEGLPVCSSLVKKRFAFVHEPQCDCVQINGLF